MTYILTNQQGQFATSKLYFKNVVEHHDNENP